MNVEQCNLIKIVSAEDSSYLFSRAGRCATLVRYSATPQLTDSLNGSGVAVAVSVRKKLGTSGSGLQQNEKRYRHQQPLKG